MNGTNNQAFADLSQFEGNFGAVARPPVSSQSVFNTVEYKYDPNSGYTDMSKIDDSPDSALDVLSKRLKSLESNTAWDKVDKRSLKYLRELAAADPQKWGGKLAEKERFLAEMGDSFRERVKGLSLWVELGRQDMTRPDVNVDPKYRAAFEAKAKEVQDFAAAWIDPQTLTAFESDAKAQAAAAAARRK